MDATTTKPSKSDWATSPAFPCTVTSSVEGGEGLSVEADVNALDSVPRGQGGRIPTTKVTSAPPFTTLLSVVFAACSGGGRWSWEGTVMDDGRAARDSL